MKKTILTFFIFALSFSMFAQTNSAEIFAVNAPIGWANFRAGAGTDHRIITRMPNKTIVFRDIDRPRIGGWIPIINEWIDPERREASRNFERSERHRPTPFGYMHESMLMPLQEPYASKIINFFQGFYPTHSYRFSGRVESKYLMSFDIPYLLLMNDNFRFIVRDFRINEDIFEVGSFLGYPTVVLGDTISFFTTFWTGIDYFNSDYMTSGRPMSVFYKLFKNENGEYDFYTEIFPQPRTIPIEEAKALVAFVRQATGNWGQADDDYPQSSIWAFWGKLFLAYVSGVEEAWDIIFNWHTDASLSHEIDIYLRLFDAYRRSKLNPR